MTAALEFEWTLTALAAVENGRHRAPTYRLRVRTAAGEKATDVTRAEVPVRIAELCTRLGLEGVAMSEGIDLTTLAKARAAKLTEIDREIAEREREFEAEIATLRQQRRRLVIEARELDKALARVEASLGKKGRDSGETSAKLKASWTPERRAKMAEAMRRRNEAKAKAAKRGARAA